MHRFNSSKLGYFRLLTKVYSSCDDTSKYACFVMDHAGFLVLHTTFVQPSVTEQDIEQVHITQKEKHIAEDLISKGFLVKKECRNVETIKKQSFYEINLPQDGVDELTENSDSHCKYKLAPISGTNVYLGNREQFLVAIIIVAFSHFPLALSMNGIRIFNGSNTNRDVLTSFNELRNGCTYFAL